VPESYGDFLLCAPKAYDLPGPHRVLALHVCPESQLTRPISRQSGKCEGEGCGRDDGTGCKDSPGFGSGLTWNPCTEKVDLACELEFVGISSGLLFARLLLVTRGSVRGAGVYHHGPRAEPGLRRFDDGLALRQ